jgi:abhydrolase domain-containing protein 12
MVHTCNCSEHNISLNVLNSPLRAILSLYNPLTTLHQVSTHPSTLTSLKPRSITVVEMLSALAVLTPLFATFAGTFGIYIAFILLLAIPRLQDHVIYLHKVTLTWFRDVNVPEQWGFLRNQVTPFHLNTPDGQTLHAWHILPLDTYQKYQAELIAQPVGLVDDIEQTLSFQLLKDDPAAHLVIYFHGAAGTLGSGWRPQSYRALSASTPKLHVLAIDYRGYGSSTGWPSESGMLTDALTLVNYAVHTLGIPTERIVIFGQSIGTAVAISLAHELALQTPATVFAGMVLVAPLADVETSTQTYKIAGVVPLLSPLAFCPSLLGFFNKFILSKWPSKAKLANMIRHFESLKRKGHANYYDVTLIHAEDDWDMPWVHSEILFSHAVHAIQDDPTFTKEDFEKEKASRKVCLGAGGWEVKWDGKNGVVREQIVKHGLHDRIMSYPVVSLAVSRAFKTARPRHE